MSKTRPWSEVRRDKKADPEREARIDAIKAEMDRQIKAASVELVHRTPSGSFVITRHLHSPFKLRQRSAAIKNRLERRKSDARKTREPKEA